MHVIDAIREAFVLLLHGDPVLLGIAWVSFKTTLIALAIATPPAVVGGYLLAHHRFAGRRLLIWLAQASLAVPTVLIGLVLYLCLSRAGVFGGLHWLFTQTGIVAGQVLIGLPVLLAFSLAAVQAADPRLAETAITLGAARWRVMWTLLYEVRYGVLAAVISGFGRVVSEVGCAIMVGGNIAGSTRTITTAITLETSKGEFARSIALGLLLVVIAAFINLALVLLQGDAGSPKGVA